MHNGSPFTVHCYHMHFLIRSRSARNSPNLLSPFSPASSPGRNVCYQSLPDIVQLRNITAITLPTSATCPDYIHFLPASRITSPNAAAIFANARGSSWYLRSFSRHSSACCL